jgi:hypothetical protein
VKSARVERKRVKTLLESQDQAKEKTLVVTVRMTWDTPNGKETVHAAKLPLGVTFATDIPLTVVGVEDHGRDIGVRVGWVLRVVNGNDLTGIASFDEAHGLLQAECSKLKVDDEAKLEELQQMRSKVFKEVAALQSALDNTSDYEPSSTPAFQELRQRLCDLTESAQVNEAMTYDGHIRFHQSLISQLRGISEDYDDLTTGRESLQGKQEDGSDEKERMLLTSC